MTTTTVDITDDLDAFSKEFFEPKEAPEAEPEKEPEPEVEKEEDLEPEPEPEGEDEDEGEEDDGDLGEEDDPPASDDDDDDEEEEAEKPKPKKRHSAQERINELTKAKREAERREAALLRRFEELEASVKKGKPEPEETPLREMLSADAPSPDKLDKDGEAFYPLGEFDPLYIRDLTRFTIEQESKRVREEQRIQTERERDAAIQKQLSEDWIERVEAVEEEIPDLREKMEDLTETFSDLDPAYGQYLAATLMASELGPQIMYYLSENIGEAQKIVASGPAAATLAIGRLEAKLAQPSPKQDIKRDKVVSSAPKPPESRTRGRGSKFATRPDTDDLDAFEKEFFRR